MVKNDKKTKLYKGAVLGAAGLMCLSFTPVTALHAFADYLGDDAANTIGSEVIIVDGADGSVIRGEKYEIQNAYFGTSKKVKLGLSETDYATKLASGGEYEGLGYEGNPVTKISSEIKVTYSTGAEAQITANTSLEDYYGTFEADEVGEYTISYAITVEYDGTESKTYSTEVLVQSETGSAALSFEDAEVKMPSVYDMKLATKDNALKDIELAIPTVYDNDEEENVTLDDVLVNEVPGAGTGKVVSISVAKTSNGEIELDKDNGKVYIRGEEIKENVSNNDNIVLTYAYYVDGDYVTSTTKTIRVYEDHYADAKGNSTYKLTAALSSNVVSAVTKVAVKLPTISLYASEEMTDKVDATTTITAYRKVNGKFTEVAPEGHVAIEDGKFTPWADGDYKIVYSVTDFYETETITKQILIEGVKDTQRPEAIIYDAGNDQNVKAESKFVSAKNIVKTKANQNNIIVYAIGGTDNVSTASDMKYTRTIKSSARTIEINNIYNDYNLIFDATAKLYDSTNTEQALLNDNYHLYAQIKADFEADGTKSLTNDADIKEWLLEHNYLFVTNAPVDDKTDEAYCISKGYAYIDVNEITMIPGLGEDGTKYTVSYVATDKAGKVSETTSYEMYIYNGNLVVSVDAVPQIKMDSTFKRYYSLKDTISFAKPTIEDENDDYIDSTISFKLYNGASEVYAHEFTSEEDLKINIKKIVKELIDEWIAEDPTNNTKENFANYPTKVELTVYAVNDFGYDATWTKTLDIIDVVDVVAPTLIRENYNTNHTSITQNEEITLPTIVYTDDYANFMSSEVRVYHIAKEGKVAVESNNMKTDVNNRAKTYTLNAGSFMAAFAGEYEVVVKTKDYASNYIVSYYYYSVDAKNEINKPFINSSLSKETKLETGEKLTLPVPQVDYTLDNDYDIYGVNVPENENTVSDKSATNYKVVVKGGNPSDYELLDNETFVGYNFKEATYSLAYEINLQIVKKGYNLNKTPNGITLTKGSDTYYMSRFANELTANGEHTGDYILVTYNGGKIQKVIYGEVVGTAINFYNITSNLNGEGYITDVAGAKYEAALENGLVFKKNGGKAEDYISAEVDGGVLKFTTHGNVSLASTEISGLDTETIANGNSDNLTTKEFTEITLTTETYNVTVADTVAPKLTPGTSYYYDTIAEKGSVVAIAPIRAYDPSGYMGSGIDKEKSYVKVAFSGRTASKKSTSYSAEYYMKDWASKANAQNDIEYTLSTTNNGTYTISYHIFDKAGNEISTELGKTKFEIKVGDTEAPELKFGEDFIQESYKVGSSLSLNMKSIDLSDKQLSEDEYNLLMKDMKVTVKNTTTNDTIDNNGDGIVEKADGTYEGYFTYDLSKAGTYSIEVQITDEAGWTTTKTLNFEVVADEKEAGVVSTVVGIVLVVVAVTVLAGVVIYFVVSKIKLDKELGGKKKNDKK